MRRALVLFLCGCAPAPEVVATWPASGDGFCIDSFGEGRANAGPLSIPVQIEAARRNGRVVDLAGAAVRLRSVDDDPSLPVIPLAEGVVGVDGLVTLDLELLVPTSEVLVEAVLEVEVRDRFEPVDERAFLGLEVVANTDRPWIGCQEWQDADGTPIPPDVALRVGAEATLAFHVEGNVGGAPDVEIVFRERGGDLCGPDPFGAFTTPVLSGPNAVPWRVDLAGLDVCESESGASELTFSTPSYLEEDGVWQGTRESPEREVL